MRAFAKAQARVTDALHVLDKRGVRRKRNHVPVAVSGQFSPIQQRAPSLHAKKQILVTLLCEFVRCSDIRYLTCIWRIST
jgi:hypothetical protein